LNHNPYFENLGQNRVDSSKFIRNSENYQRGILKGNDDCLKTKKHEFFLRKLKKLRYLKEQ
jgi:hypothetical protein